MTRAVAEPAPRAEQAVAPASSSVWLRGALRAASVFYGAAVRLRNRAYDRGWRRVSVGVPVISVGNITVGGTGKTPLVIDLAGRLLRQGRKVGVLARGYRAAGDSLGDELALVARRLPQVVCLRDPDRVRGARTLVDRHGVEVIVLDDGFQHRRLARDMDLVLIDATCPFGGGYLLPRGRLREPLSSLRRASSIVLTRVDQVSPEALAALRRRLEELLPHWSPFETVHAPAGFVELDGSAARAPSAGTAVVCVSAVGNPDAFERTVRQLGLNVRAVLRWPDHHRYGPEDVARIEQEAQVRGADIVVTTEKDAVKLAESSRCGVRVVALRVDVLYRGDDEGLMEFVMEQVLEFKPKEAELRGESTSAD